MDIQDQRLANNRIIRTKLCKQCWGALTEKYIGGQATIVCAADSSHQGFIGQVLVICLERQQRSLAAEVRRNYPEFYPPRPQKMVEESIHALFPEAHL